MKNSNLLIVAILAFLLGYGACYVKPELLRGHSTATAQTETTTKTAAPVAAVAPKVDTIKSAPILTSSTSAVNTNEIFRTTLGTKVANDDYYMYGLTYSADGSTLNSIRFCDLATGSNFKLSGGVYKWTAEGTGTISGISPFTITYYTLTASTLTCRAGVITGNDGSDHSFAISDVVSVSGGAGTVTFGVVTLETIE